MSTIPLIGKAYDEILEEMASFRSKDADFLNGRTWSLVYHLNHEHDSFLKKAHNLYFSENALNPMAFKSLKRFEHEVVKMTADLLNGDENVVGTMTSGGTESCLLPVMTYREQARSKKRWGKFQPEIIAPESIHVAWEKAAKYFNVKMVSIPLKDDFMVDLDILKKKISKNTILITASAPSYPHGLIDPIKDIGLIADERNIPFHVDACLGGFFLPFAEQIGYQIPEFDFRCKGVTSISADVHKYGFGAKGASILLYKNMALLKHQFFIHQNWPGGVFASPALLGTRPGGPIAAAWAAMNAMGEKGYQDMAQKVMVTTQKLIQGINDLQDLKVMGKPQMSVFAYASTNPKIDIFAIGDVMEEKGWHIDRLQRPEGLHAMVTPAHEAVADQYLVDLKDSLEFVKSHPDLASKGNAAMYGMIANVPFRGLIKNQVGKMMEKMYGPECEMPMDNQGKESLPVRIGTRILKWISKRKFYKK
ncbi:MAG: aspartate aminotransferase family protein [Desulfobacula sp.]|jgi:sphinganine-1-phosphate aldolase|uniref:pyridoxal phosphate-dependent decarboxylase family protein n=1 Tax=Desulfobacula sp. TaxID=2593537 RepID=UPI001D561DF8|nr:aspartate aminotransferase family protein [Desulfobacula sp.]MBT3484916.1 aspartate aminotransferase family protein [Desulfobacula sp.]MBT3803248.1 aspartate aminotransferase family protein [Desulfobacula sp.]MBT4024631.1 aspartate aminotransferase family protein [Desulfobacula sp.]MBT4200419.1 aspartate aminotransferase family protein [Desulfobacula sp.]